MGINLLDEALGDLEDDQQVQAPAKIDYYKATQESIQEEETNRGARADDAARARSPQGRSSREGGDLL